MLQRNCAGGIVFFESKVLLLRSDKNEWVLPKGLIPTGALSHQVALSRVSSESGVKSARVLAPGGETRYEFYSTTRKMPVCNRITWYIMASDSDHSAFNTQLGFTGGGFFPIEKALELITYSQDKALVQAAWAQYQALAASGAGKAEP